MVGVWCAPRAADILTYELRVCVCLWEIVSEFLSFGEVFPTEERARRERHSCAKEGFRDSKLNSSRSFPILPVLLVTVDGNRDDSDVILRAVCYIRSAHIEVL